jgi:hypothetical protein
LKWVVIQKNKIRITDYRLSFYETEEAKQAEKEIKTELAHADSEVFMAKDRICAARKMTAKSTPSFPSFAALF